MRYLLVFLIVFFSLQNTSAQIYEFGVFAGGSNFIGDVGATNYIAPNQPAIGAIVKWNRSPRHAFRASVIFTNLEAVDAESSDRRRQLRNYGFRNGLFEASLGMEFTFFDFNLHDEKRKGTPYLYTGVTTANHANFYFNNSGELIQENTNSWAFGIPITLGYKLSIASHFILGAEIGARYTFSDELDGSVPDGDFRDVINFGNINSNDWYVFSGFTLTYTFGQRPCYCGF